MQRPARITERGRHAWAYTTATNRPNQTDDNFDWLQQEEITGTKTYEHDIAEDSGLTVSATNPNLRGDVSIEVYENGTLKSQDTDSTGLAQIIY